MSQRKSSFSDFSESMGPIAIFHFHVLNLLLGGQAVTRGRSWQHPGVQHLWSHLLGIIELGLK